MEFEEASVNDADDSMYAVSNCSAVQVGAADPSQTSAKQKKSTWDYKDAIEHIRKTERPSASVAVNIGEVIEMKRQAMKAAVRSSTHQQPSLAWSLTFCIESCRCG